jgi:CheY-like chemotaxis protein
MLVVEDDSYGSQVVASMLKYHKISADFANTAEEALEFLRSNQYSMAIIDLNLPGIDGWTLLQSIRSNTDTAYLPCVAITAYHDARVAQEALQAGFTGYFPKPLDTGFVPNLEHILAG